MPEVNEKPKLPSKWSAFAPRDSKALETAFQKMIENPNEPSLPVPVNEDHLFEVDIVARELTPVYFRGSTYEVLSLSHAWIDVFRFVEQDGSFKTDRY